MQFQITYNNELHTIVLDGSKPTSSLYLQIRKQLKIIKNFSLIFRQDEVLSSKQKLSEIFAADAKNYVAILDKPEKLQEEIKRKSPSEIVTWLKKAKNPAVIINSIEADQLKKVAVEFRQREKKESRTFIHGMFAIEQYEKKQHKRHVLEHAVLARLRGETVKPEDVNVDGGDDDDNDVAGEKEVIDIDDE